MRRERPSSGSSGPWIAIALCILVALAVFFGRGTGAPESPNAPTSTPAAPSAPSQPSSPTPAATPDDDEIEREAKRRLEARLGAEISRLTEGGYQVMLEREKDAVRAARKIRRQ